MKAVILAGGLGTRMREETEFRPKPMVEVGGRPVLWHIMKILSSQGISEFVICTGYKSEVIKNYFLDYGTLNLDFTVSLGQSSNLEFHGKHDEENWHVTVADTGPTTMTGGRVHFAKKYLGSEDFLITYGDGIADVNLTELQRVHTETSATVTLTAAKPKSRFGVLQIGSDSLVTNFTEKPEGLEWVNIGYMIAKSSFLDLLGPQTILENEPLEHLAQSGKLAAHLHRGFWQPMDTQREANLLNELWATSAPWKIWK